MTLALVGIAAGVFTVLAGVVHTVWDRRQQRRAQEQLSSIVTLASQD
jgi:hypothetical protein